jgi:uncharacterized protein (TIGR00369 family)
MPSPSPDNYIARLMRGEAPMHAVGTTLGARFVALDLDAGRLDMTYEGARAFLNPAGLIQGGMLGAMLDDVAASLVTATLGADERCATLDLHLSFLRPAAAGPVAASARLLRRGRDVCNVSAELRQGERLVATATATCMVVGATRGLG